MSKRRADSDVFLGDARWRWEPLRTRSRGGARTPFPRFPFASLSRGRAPPGASGARRAAGGRQRAPWRRAGGPDPALPPPPRSAPAEGLPRVTGADGGRPDTVLARTPARSVRPSSSSPPLDVRLRNRDTRRRRAARLGTGTRRVGAGER